MIKYIATRMDCREIDSPFLVLRETRLKNCLLNLADFLKIIGIALSIFWGGALSISEPKLNTILIDDPIGHFDDINVLSFIDVLRTIINKTNWQIIISTHEENFYEIMKVKLSSECYNSKFFVFESEGTIIQDK